MYDGKFLCTYPENPWIDKDKSVPKTPNFNRGHVMVYVGESYKEKSKWSFLCKPEAYLIIPDRFINVTRRTYDSMQSAQNKASCIDCKYHGMDKPVVPEPQVLPSFGPDKPKPRTPKFKTYGLYIMGEISYVFPDEVSALAYKDNFLREAGHLFGANDIKVDKISKQKAKAWLLGRKSTGSEAHLDFIDSYWGDLEWGEYSEWLK